MMIDCPNLTTPTVEYRHYAAAPQPPAQYFHQQASRDEYVYGGINATANRNESIGRTEKWQFDCLKLIASLGKLPVNWDGYGSRPPTDSVRQWASDLVVQTRLGILTAPQIAPESDGGLQIDWHSGLGREIEFHIEDGTAIEFLKVQGGKGIEAGTFSPTDRAATDRLLNWLRRG